MKSEVFRLHQRAMHIIYEHGSVAIAFDTLKGPRSLYQGWHDCSQILTPLICKNDTLRPWVVWYRSWNRPRFDFVNALVKICEQQKG